MNSSVEKNASDLEMRLFHHLRRHCICQVITDSTPSLATKFRRVAVLFVVATTSYLHASNFRHASLTVIALTVGATTTSGAISSHQSRSGLRLAKVV
ncbi:hypothetical protein QYF36_008107 [Acer negundo]|nr:hypothetical protein QYF36_008107 [Acer negundo]